MVASIQFEIRRSASVTRLPFWGHLYVFLPSAFSTYRIANMILSRFGHGRSQRSRSLLGTLQTAKNPDVDLPRQHYVDGLCSVPLCHLALFFKSLNHDSYIRTRRREPADKSTSLEVY